MAIKILLFSFFFLFVQILAGKDDPSLGLIQENVDDAVNAPKKAAMRWTSVLTFPKVKDVWEDVLGKDPNKLSEVARNGFWQMNKKWNDEGVPKKQHASVMTALAIGKEIYLSSSLTGAENFLYKFPVADSNHPYVPLL